MTMKQLKVIALLMIADSVGAGLGVLPGGEAARMASSVGPTAAAAAGTRPFPPMPD